MFDLSWTEILIVGGAALIFIGPKELPGTLRTIGKFVSKARGMAREFQGSVQEMVRESELDEIKKQVDKVTTGDYVSSIEKQIDPTGEINSALSPPSTSALSAPNTMAPPGAPPALSPPATTPPRPTT
jgi:sec-independent protein translocase protein TatB